MIIDLILDRKDGKEYVPGDFYTGVMGYLDVFPEIVIPIAEAMENGEESDVQRVLCEYIERNDYNPELCGYVRSVKWLEPDALPLNPICIDCKVRGATCDGTTYQAWTGCVYRKI
jgi:hypothetical protein